MAPDEPTTDYAPPSPPPPPAAPPVRRLERSRRDRKFAGVCGGLGEYFDLDPIIFRIGFVVLTVAGGSGMLLYGLAWVFLPEEGRRRSIGESLPRNGHPHWLPIALLVIGGLMLSGQMFDHRGGGGFGLGFTLLAVGGFILWRRQQRENPWHEDDHHDIDAPRPPQSPSSPSGMYPPRWTPPAPDVPWTAPGVTPWSPADDGLDPDLAAYTTARQQAADELPPSPPIWPPLDLPPAPRVRSMTPILLSFLLLFGGVAALLSATGAMHITVGVYLAVALILTGLTFLIGAWRGETRGLLAIAVILTLALSVASVVKDPLRGGLGQRTWAPTSISELERPYRLGAGDATLDLRKLRLPPGRHVVAARVGFGQLKVLVPYTTNVVAQAESDLGQARVFGQQRENGNQLDVTQTINSSEGQPTLVLHLHVNAGQVEVTRAAAA